MQLIGVILGGAFTFVVGILGAIAVANFKEFPPKDLYDKLSMVFIFSMIGLIMFVAAAITIGAILN